MKRKTGPGAESGQLAEYTNEIRKGAAIEWYRSPLSSADMKSLHRRSDARGWFQTLGYLGLIALTTAISIYSASHWPWWATLVSVFLHGTVMNFLINGVHELGHGTVFKTKGLNNFFTHLLAFLGWINHETFQTSHTRHHRYTLHPPDDLEVVLPIKLMIRHFFTTGFVYLPSILYGIRSTLRIARGRFKGEWEMTLYPENKPELRRIPVRWARILLIGHALLALVSLGLGNWIIPVLFVFPPFYGSWLQFLCNNTQHIGLQDNVSDFRLCCRTFTLNPFFRFLYWHMNYHTEHHMYAAVPCYNLGKLHTLIRHDLPPCPDGLIAVWKEIIAIQAKQEKDPSHQHQPVLPIRETSGYPGR